MQKNICCKTKIQYEGVRYMAKVIDFGVFLTVSSAFNEMYTAHMMLRDSPLFKNEIKRLTNIAMSKMSLCKKTMISSTASDKFFDLYTDNVIDLAEDDIALFRIAIKQAFDDEKFEYAELVSYLETARVMLEMASIQFDKVVGVTKDRFYEIDTHGIPITFDYAKAFSEFDCKPILNAWTKVCDSLYATKVVISEKSAKRILSLYEHVGKKFAEGDYVQECMDNAIKEHPELWDEIKKRQSY